MEKKKDFEALVLIYQQLDNSSLLDKYKEDSIKLAEIAIQTQENRDFWMAFIQKAVQQSIISVLGVILKGLVVL